MEFVNWTLANSDSLVTAALAVIGAASAVAAIFGKSDNKYIEYARKFVNLIALNLGKAKNKE